MGRTAKVHIDENQTKRLLAGKQIKITIPPDTTLLNITMEFSHLEHIVGSAFEEVDNVIEDMEKSVKKAMTGLSNRLKKFK